MEAEKISTAELLKQYTDIIEELKNRGVIRTRNNPVADYAEWLVSSKMGLVLGPNSQPGYDAISVDKKIRFQIKSRRLENEKSSRQLGVIRNLEEEKFDFLIVVIFSNRFTVLEAYRIPRIVIASCARFSPHQNGHVLVLKGAILKHPDVELITDQLM